MAEPQKGGSSPVKSKAKNSMLDDVDFGQDFLTSWKPMSMGKDDNMDFDFQPSAKGKKKAFDFDKMDVDFSLDGDMDKISSFKVDFFDLDISSPAKKGGKLDEKAKDKSSGGKDKQKQDSFPFDFDDVGSFSPEPNLPKGVKHAEKNDEIKEASNRSEGQSSESDPTVRIGSSEDVVNLKLASLKDGSTSNTETPLGSFSNTDTVNNNLSSNSERRLTGTSESAPVQVASEELRTLPGTTRDSAIEEIGQVTHREEDNTSSRKLHAQETSQIPPSVSENESTRDSNLDLQVVALTDLNSNPSREQNATSQPVCGPELLPENAVLENSTAQHAQVPMENNGERSRLFNEHNIPSGSTDVHAPAQGNPKSVDTSITIISRDSGKEPLAIKDKHIAKTGLSLLALSSAISVGAVNGIKEKENAVIQSRFFKKSSTKESQPDQRYSDKTKATMVLGNIISSRQRADERRKENEAQDAGMRNKLAKISGSRDGDEHVQTGRTPTVQGLKSVGSSELNIRNSATPSLRSSVSSMVDSNSTRDEVNKVPVMKADKSSFDLSSLKLSGSTGNQHSEKTTSQKQISSLLTRMQISEPQASTASKVARSISMESHPLRTPLLKRKLDEASKPDTSNLTPLKRLSPSPRESRVSRDVPAKTTDKEDCTSKRFADSPAILQKDCQIREVNMTEAQITLVMPNDDTVDKAEAYAKELEEICNMLKKKHEEAKELLVRAVVNNNNMLMLNHPMHEEKIRKVQKFACRLMSRELTA